MRIAQVSAVLVGSFAVFLACSVEHAVDPAPTRHADAGALDAAVDAVRDALGIDVAPPVRDAQAAPTTATVDAPCDNTFGSVGLTFGYAEASFLGRTKDDLARVAVYRCGDASAPPGYSCVIVSGPNVWIRDGAVAAVCTAGSTVRFVLTGGV